MAKSFLLIGVGGSGGKTLRYAEREVSRRLNEIGWTEGIPDAWRFLHIDVPSEPDVIEGDVPAKTGKTARYLGLADPNRRYRDYDADLIRQRDQLPQVAGWRPDPNGDYAPPYKGAGQRRVVGRVVAASRIGDLKGAIEDELMMMNAAGGSEQLRRLDDLAKNKLGGELGSGGVGEQGIVVAASLGGGSGSGIFLDILEILTAEDLGARTMPILYAADVFSQLSREASAGIEANSLAAVSELLSAFEHKGPVSEDEAEFLGRTGTSQTHGGKRVDCVSFFVGRGNGSMTFAHSADVFRSMGKAISAFMLNPGVAEEYGKYVGNNLSAKDLQPEFGMSNPTATKQAGSSLGYASVTLGRSLFAEYTAERLAKGALETLLRGHRRDLGPDDLSRDETLINKLVCGDEDGAGGSDLGIRAQFFEAAGLWEESPDNNQVLDALRSVDEKKQRLNAVMTSVMEKLRATTSERPAGQWLDAFKSDFDDAAAAFLAEDKSDRTKRAQNWTIEVQSNLCDATADYVGTYGLPVTIKLLDELSDQLDRAEDELNEDAAKFIQEEGRSLRGVRQIFEGITEKLITTRHQAFEQAAKQRRGALRRSSEADVYRLAAQLMTEIRTDVIPPLKTALAAALQRLISGEEADHSLMVQQWSAGPVPSHLRPAPNEFVLEDVAGFPDRAGRVLMELLESSRPGNAEQKAIAELVSGAWVKSNADEIKQSLIGIDSTWFTANPEARDLGTPSSGARFRSEIDVPDLLDRARNWVRSRESIGAYMHGSLAQWLDKGEVDAGERGRTFVNALAQALESSGPLITVDASVYRKVCGDDPPPPARVIGDIPMASDHPEYPRVKETLIRAGVNEGDVERRFNANSSAGSVEISSFMSQSMHPIVFESIFEPIYKDWKGRTGPARTQFWDYRRSRLLPSFVPLSPGRQLALVRGWWIAHALGQVSDEPRSVWTPRGPKAFPDVLLGRGVTERNGELPALMETLPLAMVAYANGDGEHLDAYRRLLELGACGPEPGSNGGTSSFESPLSDPAAFDEVKKNYRLGRELRDWLKDGKTREPDSGFPAAPIPLAQISGQASDTSDARAELMEKTLAIGVENIRAFMKEYETLTPEMTLSVPTRWELRSRIDVATDQLHKAVGAFRNDAADDQSDDGIFA